MENKFSLRTDLAIEVTEQLTKEAKESSQIEGVKIETKNTDNNNIKLTWVSIENEKGSETMGKPIGNYVTIESDLLKQNEPESHEKIIDVLSKNLVKLCNLNENSVILVVGLGNWNVTPDALGPKVISKILVTRHIKETLPDEIYNTVRPVSAISPGVMGITGIETAEVIKGIVEKTKPDLVIAIDALAARCSSRINSTIQMTDTGVSPGSGMGNKRKSLTLETLNVPVIAIGVPTVVDAATLVNDTIDTMVDSMLQEVTTGSEFYEMLKDLSKEEKYELIKKILDPYTSNMFVTPKEVDSVIERLSKIISNSINIALHQGITFDDINKYIN